MAPDRCAVAARRSLLASERSAPTPRLVTRPAMASATMISMSVKPRSPVAVLRMGAVGRVLLQLPGLDVVGGPLGLVGAAGDDVRAVGVVGPRTAQDEVLPPRIFGRRARHVLLRHEVV